MLGWVAVKMMVDDPLVVAWLEEARVRLLQQFAPYLLGAVIALLGWWFARNVARDRRMRA